MHARNLPHHATTPVTHHGAVPCPLCLSDNTDALIYVVDSNDPSRMVEARDELHAMLADDGLRRAAVLVMANKQDLRSAERPDKVAEALGLHALRSHEWYLQPCSAATGDGVVSATVYLSRVRPL